MNWVSVEYTCEFSKAIRKYNQNDEIIGAIPATFLRVPCSIRCKSKLPVSIKRTKPFVLCTCYTNAEHVYFESVEEHYRIFKQHVRIM